MAASAEAVPSAEPDLDHQPAQPRRAPRFGLIIAAVAAVCVALAVQAKVVSSTFSSPLDAGAGLLPASLETLAQGPGPVIADGPFLPPARPALTAPRLPVTSATADDISHDLSNWAQRLGAAVGIPPVAMAAYGSAQLELAQTQPGCHLSWPTLAGIGSVESDHGRHLGAVLGSDGRSTPPIIGVALDGHPGVARIGDTDQGALDGDTTYDRAVGPMQFLPATWGTWASDGDGDGALDPFDLADAALGAGRYLCAAGGDLATGGGWTQALYAYNPSADYVLLVRSTADEFASRSTSSALRSVAP